MNKEFIPYEQALALKELGFAEPCFARYADMTLPKKTGSFLSRTDWDTMHVNFIESQSVSAPLYQQAFRWFREKHNLWIEVHVEDNVKLGEQKYYWRIFGEYTSYEENSWIRAKVDSNGVMSNTYEEAEQACLDKLIEIITKQD